MAKNAREKYGNIFWNQRAELINYVSLRISLYIHGKRGGCAAILYNVVFVLTEITTIL